MAHNHYAGEALNDLKILVVVNHTYVGEQIFQMHKDVSMVQNSWLAVNIKLFNGLKL